MDSFVKGLDSLGQYGNPTPPDIPNKPKQQSQQDTGDEDMTTKSILTSRTLVENNMAQYLEAMQKKDPKALREAHISIYGSTNN